MRIVFIGAGAMGMVYKARQLSLDRTVALKILPPAFASSPALVKRFHEETHVLSALNHPNVCVVHEIGEIALGEQSVLGHDTKLAVGTPFIAMELIEGRTLASRIREAGPWSDLYSWAIVIYGLVVGHPGLNGLPIDAYCRLVAMKLFALRAADYMRVASKEDRRYLLYNPMVKMKVTTQGEEVIDLLWDVIAAKGFEKDTYFEMAARDIRALPKLEGTVHVNIALIVKFMRNYFFFPTPQFFAPLFLH